MEAIHYKKISELKPYENNPRNNDEAAKAVAESIKQFGFKIPIVIDKDNVIVCGHTRYKAAKILNIVEVPCIVADDLTPKQIKAFRLADNKTAEQATWNDELLAAELSELIDFDMTAFGFEQEEDVDSKDIIEDEYEAEPPNEPKTKPGERYRLGNHVLMCGDSTNPEDVDKLMDGEQADLLLTDPPYNVAVSNSKGKTIENDNMSKTQFSEFINSAMKNASQALKPGGSYYVWYGDNEDIAFRSAMFGNAMPVRSCLIWVKHAFTFGRQDYKWQHEPCLYGWKEGAAHYFSDIYNESTVIEDAVDVDKMKKDELKKLCEQLLEQHEHTTIIREKRPTVDDLHPTMKPVKLFARLMKNSTQQGEKVLDLFTGSGTSIIAAEQLNRRCYAMEYDPAYADVIIDRWEQFTGKKAELIE